MFYSKYHLLIKNVHLSKVFNIPYYKYLGPFNTKSHIRQLSKIPLQNFAY